MARRSARTPRLPPEIRRRQILDAALRVSAASSISAMTVDAVAREAGITRPVVYDHFGDLDGLLEALVEDAEQQALAAVGGALPDPSLESPPDEVLGEAMRTFADAVRSRPDIWRLILLPPDGTPVAVRRRIERRRAELADGIGELVDIVAERSGILAGVDRHVFARVLIAVAEELGRAVLSSPRRYTPNRIARATAQLARLIPAPGAAR